MASKPMYNQNELKLAFAFGGPLKEMFKIVQTAALFGADTIHYLPDGNCHQPAA